MGQASVVSSPYARVLRVTRAFASKRPLLEKYRKTADLDAGTAEVYCDSPLVFSSRDCPAFPTNRSNMLFYFRFRDPSAFTEGRTPVKEL